jgi:hypothetical protein
MMTAQTSTKSEYTTARRRDAPAPRATANPIREIKAPRRVIDAGLQQRSTYATKRVGWPTVNRLPL